MTHCFNCGLREKECECDGTDGLHYKKCNCKKYGNSYNMGCGDRK